MEGDLIMYIPLIGVVGMSRAASHVALSSYVTPRLLKSAFSMAATKSTFGKDLAKMGITTLTGKAMEKILVSAVENGMMTEDQANEIFNAINSGDIVTATNLWLQIMKGQNGQQTQ